jgi:hypothetical protein
VEFSNQATPFLWNIAHKPDSLNNPAIYVSLNADFFDVAVTGNNMLLLYNTFQYVNETDLLYYVLYVCKQLKLKTSDIPLVLSGELSSKPAYVDMLKQYLPATAYDAGQGIPPLASGLLPVVTYMFLNIFNLESCVSSVESIEAE